MNKNRREILKKAIDLLELASSYVSKAADQEQECLDNLPESLECSDRYEKMELAIDYLNDATDNINEAVLHIEDASE